MFPKYSEQLLIVTVLDVGKSTKHCDIDADGLNICRACTLAIVLDCNNHVPTKESNSAQLYHTSKSRVELVSSSSVETHCSFRIVVSAKVKDVATPTLTLHRMRRNLGGAADM